jgi:hypothetical protein
MHPVTHLLHSRRRRAAQGPGIKKHIHRGDRLFRTRFGCATAALLAILVGCAEQQAVFRIDDLPVIKLPGGAVQVLAAPAPLDTPVLSNDGRRLAVQVQIYEDPFLPYEIYDVGVAERNAAGRWSPLEIVDRGRYAPYLGHMQMPIQPAFDAGGTRLYLTRIHFDSMLSIPSFWSVRSWIEEIPWRGGAAERVIEPADWGIPATELLQHARLSPDGRRLAFYTRVHPGTQGVYLLDLRSGKHYRLSAEHDKHPTWSPDGRRLYFHLTQGGKRHRFDVLGSGVERSVLGWFELDFAGGGLEGWRRVLMDELNGEYVFQKHPVVLPGTDLVFFHGQSRPDGDKHLMVRRAAPGSRVYVLSPTWAGGKLKEAKHPCASFETSDLMFIAKPKGGKDYSLLLRLTDDALRKIEETVKEDERGRQTGLAPSRASSVPTARRAVH